MVPRRHDDRRRLGERCVHRKPELRELGRQRDRPFSSPWRGSDTCHRPRFPCGQPCLASGLAHAALRLRPWGITRRLFRRRLQRNAPWRATAGDHWTPTPFHRRFRGWSPDGLQPVHQHRQPLVPPSHLGRCAACEQRHAGHSRQPGDRVCRDLRRRPVALDSDRTGRAELYRIPVSGGEPSQLTDAPGGNYMPRPSPDGRELAFQSQRSGTRDIFVMPAEGGAAQPVRVAPGDDNVPFWSPDGKRLGFVSGGGGM